MGRLSVQLAFLMVLIIGKPAHGANMLSNSSFHTDVTGWTAEPYTTVVWSSLRDVEGGPVNGSALVTNAYDVFNGGDYGANSACIAIDPATTYTVGGYVFFESSQPVGNPFISLYTYATADCSGAFVKIGATSTPRGVWSYHGVSRAYPGMYSVKIRLAISKSNRADTVRAFFDNLFMDVMRPPSITGFTPAGGFANQLVEVTGNDFYGLFPGISFNGVPASVTNVLSPTRAQATVPPTAVTSGPIRLTNINGTGTSTAIFHLQPRIDTFTPSSGKPGTGVDIRGINFHGTTRVVFSSADGRFIPVSSGIVLATVPAAAITGSVQVFNAAGLGGASGPSFVVVRPGDFSRDGRADIVLRDSNGNVSTWILNEAAIVGGSLVASPGTGFGIAGIADFSGDGKPDILITDGGGNIGMWIMDQSTIQLGAMVGNPGSGYSIAGIGDFGGDGKADILLRDVNGTIGMWTMNGAAISSGALVGSPGGSYTVAGVGDFDADYKDDILLRDSNGNLGMWFMNGATIASGAMVSSAAGYSVAGVRDFNGDDRADILLRDGAGTIGMWLMSGAAIYQGAMVGSPGPGFTIAALNDYDGDNKADILLRDSNGNLGIWMMNGGAIKSNGGLVGYPGPGYTTY